MNEANLLIERIRDELHKATNEELARVTDAEEVLKELPERTRKRLKGIIDSYRDLEITVRKFTQLAIFGLTSDTAKVVTVETGTRDRPGTTGMGSFMYGDSAETSISVGSADPFYMHPAGNKFKLKAGTKYRLLVAFIPEEEKQEVVKK